MCSGSLRDILQRKATPNQSLGLRKHPVDIIIDRI